MILVAHEKGSKELAPLIRQIGVQAEVVKLPFGDFAMEGNGPTGPISIGIERKTLHDMLACIEDGRFSGHQKVGMEQLYNVKYLAMEGVWKPHEKGFLMEGNDKGAYWICKPSGKPVMYSKLKRYLLSVQQSGVTVTVSRDMFQTAYDICEIYHWWQKPWAEHKSMLQTQTIIIPSLMGKPNLVRRWAKELPGVSETIMDRMGQKFKLPVDLALADIPTFMSIDGVGSVKAEKIFKEIRG